MKEAHKHEASRRYQRGKEEVTAEIDAIIGLQQLHSQAYLEKNLISLRRPMQDQQEAQDPLGGLTE